MALLGLFRRRAGVAAPEAADIARVKRMAFDALGASPDVAVVVNEIVCTDPGCPGTETVILIMEPGRKTRASKVAKPVDKVTEQDVREALFL